VGARASGWGFARERIVRLGVPLLFAMLAIIPVQAWCQAVVNGAWSGGFGTFLVAYFSFAPWPPGAFDGSEVGVTWNHLWYLVYLLAYTLLLVGLMPLLRHPRVESTVAWMGRRPAAAWIPLFAAVPALSALALADAWPPTNNFFADWYQHGVYLPVFLLGFLVARSSAFWASLVAARRSLLGLALVVGAVYFAVLAAAGDEASPSWVAATRVLRMLYMAAAMLAILAWSRHALDRPFRGLPAATEALFPWYILHQSLIVLTLFLLRDAGLPAMIEFSIVLVATVVGCAVGTAIIRRVAWLRPLFGLKPSSPRTSSNPPA
jgi:peptidoglycan/LPS O-acetylase OafA/YrhL